MERQITFGTSARLATVTVRDEYASPLHCMVIERTDRWGRVRYYVKDAMSTNGTYLVGPADQIIRLSAQLTVIPAGWRLMIGRTITEWRA